MPACRQCGKQNPEGTLFCGYCAASLATPVAPPPKPAEPTPSTPKPESILKHEIRQQAPPKVFKPEPRPIPVRAPAQPSDGKGGIELLPWSQLTAGQRAGRVLAGLIVLFLIFFFTRGMLRGIGSSSQSGSQPQGSDVAMSENDRRDGIESLCKVFQIYGIPKNDQDAAGSAKNAAELFKLAGNQSPERSLFILKAIAAQFRAGTLREADCAQAGAPLATTDADTSGGTADRVGGIPAPPPPANAPNAGATR